jgi:hypothetical protein
MIRKLSYLSLCAVTWLAFPGCGGDSDGPASQPDAGDYDADVPDAEAGPEAAPDTASEDVVPDAPKPPDLVISVLDPSRLPNPSEEWTPIEGATVAVDLPSGSRIELVSDSAGRVTVPSPGIEDDAITLVAHKQGYSVWSWETTVDEATRYPWLILLSLTDPELVTVSGTAIGMTSAAHQLMVNSSTCQDTSQKPGSSFDIDVPPDQPFSLVGLEFTACAQACPRCICQTFSQWTRLDHGAIDTDTTLDLDFAETLEPTHTTGTIVLPDNPESRMYTTAYPYMIVQSFEGALNHGFSLSTELSADGASFSYLAEHVVWDGSPDVTTTYYLFDNAGFAQNRLRVEGYPQEGATISGFLDVPAFSSPPGLSMGLLDAFVWTPLETTDARMVLIRDGRVVWVATVTDASRLQLPQPPTSVDLLDLLGSAPLDANFILLVNTDETNKHYEKSLLMYGYKVTP